jgi:hypothetical protein
MHLRYSPDVNVALLRNCKAINTEGQPIFYGANAFLFLSPWVERRLRSSLQQTTSARNLLMLRHLKVDVELLYQLEDD